MSRSSSAATVPAIALAWLGHPYGAVACGMLAGFFTFFFRDPGRDVPDDASLVLAPADGRVMHAGDADPAIAPIGDRRWTQGQYLSVANGRAT